MIKRINKNFFSPFMFSSLGINFYNSVQKTK
jgi:hypothetical protein